MIKNAKDREIGIKWYYDRLNIYYFSVILRNSAFFTPFLKFYEIILFTKRETDSLQS